MMTASISPAQTQHDFGKTEATLGCRRFHNNEVEMAVCEWLRMEHPDYQPRRNLNLCQKWKQMHYKCSGIALKNCDTSVE